MTAKSPPKSLSKEARRVWYELNKLYDFEYDELMLLRTALESWDIMNRARESLTRDGFTVPGQQGGEKSNPALRAYHVGRCGFLEAWKSLNLDIEPPQAAPGRPPEAIPIWKNREAK